MSNIEKRTLILKGLRYVKSAKEFEIERIERRTESDYEFDKEVLPALGQVFSLEKAKAEDVAKATNELKEIEALMEEVNNDELELQIG
ncbi:hypothetical protein [Bacillus thuringiensis]|uniref:hypothetical protein n=1 Tax=Bacillus thuringiensis TaxID=1428 RepID=UPI000BFB65FE|nr:hypothetical protein [Bacillus thuringiensis]PGT90006.1 hypothetical protein COD17_09660 [Bacillus thuringiensis]